jgi:hypothetical protein
MRLGARREDAERGVWKVDLRDEERQRDEEDERGRFSGRVDRVGAAARVFPAGDRVLLVFVVALSFVVVVAPSDGPDARSRRARSSALFPVASRPFARSASRSCATVVLDDIARRDSFVRRRRANARAGARRGVAHSSSWSSRRPTVSS